MVAGGIPDRDLAGARRRLADRLVELVPYAAERDVRLALEPLHPMYLRRPRGDLDARPGARPGRATPGARPSASSSTPSTSGGIPSLRCASPSRSAGADQLLPDLRLAGSDGRRPAAVARHDGRRGHRLRVDRRAGARGRIRGDVEVEIFNEAVWATDGHAVIETMKQRYRELVLPTVTGAE